jgi:hypothetical protein
MILKVVIKLVQGKEVCQFQDYQAISSIAQTISSMVQAIISIVHCQNGKIPIPQV